jgi:hypothetical protein
MGYRRRSLSSLGGALAAALLVVCCSGTAEYRDLPDDLVAWLPGEANTKESSSGAMGIFTGSGSFGTGISGNAFWFEGTPGSLEVQLDDMSPTDELTIEAWVRLDVIGEDIQRFVTAAGRCADGGSRVAVLRFNGPGGLHFFVGSEFPENLYHTEAPGVVRPGVFHHVAGTYGREGLKLYCDGVLVDTLAEWDGPYCLNRLSLSSDEEPLDGVVDELKIHSRVMAPHEIEATYRSVFPDRETIATDSVVFGPQGYGWRQGTGEPTAIPKSRLGSISVTVFPTITHVVWFGEGEDGQNSYSQEYDAESALVLQSFLLDREYASVEVSRDPLLVPEPSGGQGRVMENGLATFGSYLREHPISTDLAVMVELIVTSLEWDDDGQGVWAIQCYILDSEGDDAFSFVLNSHWALFNDADMFSDNRSDSARAELVSKAMWTVAAALQSHIDQRYESRL